MMTGPEAVQMRWRWVGYRAAAARVGCAGLLLAGLVGASRGAVAQSEDSEQQSCRAFVQKFYDWYWNPEADQADQPGFHQTHTPADVVKMKPPVLAPNLLRLLKSAARLPGGIAGMEFDPFLSGPDPRGKYTVGQVAVSGDECRATLPAGHVVAEVKKAGGSWVFANFHYSFYYKDGTKEDVPDTELIQMLTM